MTAQDAALQPGDLVRSRSKRVWSFVISPSDIGYGLYIDVYLPKTHVLWIGLPFSNVEVIARYEKTDAAV